MDVPEMPPDLRKKLDPAHYADLKRSALSDDRIRSGGFYTIRNKKDAQRLMGRKAVGDGPYLAMPYWDEHGKPLDYVRLKPSRPRLSKGKTVKYESPSKRPNRAYFPLGTVPVLTDAAVELLVTEGEKKALAADQHGFRCIGLSGVEAFSQPRANGPDGLKRGPRVLLSELAAVQWGGRPVFIVYDSDGATKPAVRRAEAALAGLLRAAGAVVRLVRLPAAADGAKQGVDDFLLAHGPAKLRELMKLAVAFDPAAGGSVTPSPPPSAADRLTALAADFDLWHDDAQTGYVTVGPLSYRIQSKAFRHLLVSRDRRLTGGRAVPSDAVNTALHALEASAVHDGPERVPHVRSANMDGQVYLSLADPAGTVIQIDADGWRVCPNPPVRFVVRPGVRPLPMPTRGGSLLPLRHLLNLGDDAYALLLAWLATAVRAVGPFPVLALFGEQGTSKSTTAKVAKALIDPAKAAARAQPRDERDLSVMARANWVPLFDNLSRLSDDLSDAFCRLSTGGGMSTRGLFTDDEETIFDTQRPVILNGITDFLQRPDLLQRAVSLTLQPIPEERRKTEAELWAAFERMRPAVLGALLDRVAGGLRELPRVRLDRLPRMGDFALFGVACERAAGEAPRFLDAYRRCQDEGSEQALDADPLADALLRLMDGQTRWTGTPRLLLNELSALTATPRPEGWPKGANAMSGRLRRLAPALRALYGLELVIGRASGGRSDGTRTRGMTITRTGRPVSSEPSSRSSPPTPTGTDSAPTGGSTDGDDERTRCGPAGQPVVPPHRPPPTAVAGPRNGLTAGTGDGGDAASPEAVAGRRSKLNSATPAPGRKGGRR